MREPMRGACLGWGCLYRSWQTPAVLQWDSLQHCFCFGFCFFCSIFLLLHLHTGCELQSKRSVCRRVNSYLIWHNARHQHCQTKLLITTGPTSLLFLLTIEQERFWVKPETLTSRYSLIVETLSHDAEHQLFAHHVLHKVIVFRWNSKLQVIGYCGIFNTESKPLKQTDRHYNEETESYRDSDTNLSINISLAPHLPVTSFRGYTSPGECTALEPSSCGHHTTTTNCSHIRESLRVALEGMDTI